MKWQSLKNETKEWVTLTVAGMAQLVISSEQEVPSSILGDFNVCFHFPLIRVAIGLNIRETENWQREGGGEVKRRTVGFHWYQFRNWSNYRRWIKCLYFYFNLGDKMKIYLLVRYADVLHKTSNLAISRRHYLLVILLLF